MSEAGYNLYEKLFIYDDERLNATELKAGDVLTKVAENIYLVARENIEGTVELARAFKKKFPKKTVWVWSGFLYDDIMERNKEVFDYIDVLVDGQYDDNLYSPTLKWRGSSNQRVIDVKKTKKSGNVTLFCD